MAEYIDRQKLKERLEDFSKWCRDGRKQGVDFVLDCPLPDIPTEDVVPVVRCENCKYFEIDEEDELGECKCGYISLSYGGVLYPHRTDYCNYGERRDKNEQ